MPHSLKVGPHRHEIYGNLTSNDELHYDTNPHGAPRGFALVKLIDFIDFPEILTANYQRFVKTVN